MNRIPAYAAIVAVTALMAAMAWYALTSGGMSKNTLPAATAVPQQATTASESPYFHYIEIIDGCGPYFTVGTCVNMRSGPGLEYPVVARLRTGMVLKVEKAIVQNERAWYKIIFDGAIRYPERVAGNWYVAVNPEFVVPLQDVGDEVLTSDITAPAAKRIVIDLSEEILYAYDGDTMFMKQSISTGLEFTPTPRGTFRVFKKTPSRYMQGPIPDISDQYYDLPGVPWNLYFTAEGAVIHGAYWHDRFGEPWSHGCVNLPPQKAKELYQWADVGTTVTVRD